jgi:hypothetical protein
MTVRHLHFDVFPLHAGKIDLGDQPVAPFEDVDAWTSGFFLNAQAETRD